MIKNTIYVYRKKDGTIRKINCDKNTISYFGKDNIKRKIQNDEDTHLILWDNEKEGWRTLIIENILNEESDYNKNEYFSNEIHYWTFATIVIGIMSFLIYNYQIKIDF